LGAPSREQDTSLSLVDHGTDRGYPQGMATDDDAAAKAQVPPAPAVDPKEPERKEPERKDTDRLNERLAERIRQGTVPPEPRDPREDKLNETIRQRLEHLVPELVKKTFAAGMGAVFST